MVRVYVNDQLAALRRMAGTEAVTFDTTLGSLAAGDRVAVAFGTAGPGACVPYLAWDFVLQQFSDANMAASMAAAGAVRANGVVAVSARDCEVTDTGVVLTAGGVLQA